MQQKLMLYGTNKHGFKKIYRLARFNESSRNIYFISFMVVGINLSYLTLATYKILQKQNTYLENFGDFPPFYEKTFNFTMRNAFRRVRWWVHYWKIVSSYDFNKYDIQSSPVNTGYDSAWILEHYARKRIYHKKKDDTFDFMHIGEDDFNYFNDSHP